MTDFGEFALGFPDIAEVPYPPVLGIPDTLSTNLFITRVTGAVESNIVYTVNQTLPVRLTWSPTGFAQSYHLQVSRDPAFATVEIDAPGLTDAQYVLTNPSPAITYYWRVNTTNDGGDSDWASSQFATVPPFVRVTSPADGAVWQRGISYFIQWDSNVGDMVSLDLFQGGTFLKNIKTVPNTVSYKWQADLAVPPGTNYSLRISSVTHPEIAASSSGFFSLLDAPVIDPASVVRHSDGSVQFSVSLTGAPQATVSASTNLTHWFPLGTVSFTNNTGVFLDTTAPSGPERVYRAQVP
jgi:hypothetical protein